MSTEEAVTEPINNPEGQLTDLIGSIIKPDDELQGEAPETEAATETDEPGVDAVEDSQEAGDIDNSGAPEDSQDDPEWYQKRIKRFTRQLRTAEAERDEAQSELEQLREKVKASPAPELSRVTAKSEKDLADLEELEKAKIKFAREQKRLLSQDQLDTVLENIRNAGKELDPAESDESIVRNLLDEIIDDSRDNLSFEIPKRRTELQHRAQFDQVAEQKYPWLKDSGSKEMEYFNAVVKASPALGNVPSGRLEIARYVTGLMAETTAQELVNQGQKRRSPTAPVRNQNAPATKPKNEESISEASRRVQKTGNARDLDALLLAGLTRQ